VIWSGTTRDPVVRWWFDSSFILDESSGQRS
jgi:hypothetical protein